jgi:murein DD-endopeptidase MepM/ murein hydrolase activator NlpD
MRLRPARQPAPAPWASPLATSRKPRRGRRILFLFLLIPVLSGVFAAPTTRVAGDELDDAYAKQQALAKQISKQKSQVAALTAMQGDLKADIAATARALRGINADLGAIRIRIGKMVKRVDEVKAKYDALVKELAGLDLELARVEAAELAKRQQLGERRALLGARLRGAYDTDRTSLLETFLSGGSFADVLTEVSYQLDIGEQDRALAQQIIQDQETLAALHQTVVATRQETNVLRQETAAQKRDLDKQLADLKKAQAQLKKLERETARALARQKAAYSRMAKNAAALRRSMAAAAAAQRQLAAKIDRLVREQFERGRIPSQYNGSLRWPMSGSVTQNYGCTGFPWEPPYGDCAHFHKGIDIAAPMYTPIRAAGSGTVVFAGPNPYDPYPKAWIVIIAHSQNLLTWYGHVDNATRPPTVQAGQFVRAGQVIAYNGMTGRTTGPHLHWMVEFNGDFVNPRLFL